MPCQGRTRLVLVKWEGRVLLVLWLGEAGGRGMAGVREEISNKFNPLAAMEAQRCPLHSSDGAESGSM